MADRPGTKVGPYEHRVQHDMLNVGQTAPDFKLLTNALAPRTLADYDGKVKVLSVVPSVDTAVCSAQTRRFNQEAAGLGEDIVVLTISADLPFALSRYCANNGIENSETLSTYYDMKFADDYGVHDVDSRLCQRSTFVIDKNNVVQHTEYVYNAENEPNYESALSKAREVAAQ